MPNYLADMLRPSCICVVRCRSSDKKLKPNWATSRKYTLSLVCCPQTMTDWSTETILVSAAKTHTHMLNYVVLRQIKRLVSVCVCRVLRLPVQDESTGCHQRHWWAVAFTDLLCFLTKTWQNDLFTDYEFFFSVDLPFHELGGTSAAVTGKRLRTWLLQLRNSNCMFRDSLSSLIDAVLDGYNKARHGAEVSVSLAVCDRDLLMTTFFCKNSCKSEQCLNALT